jgi:hypothetical protein
LKSAFGKRSGHVRLITRLGAALVAVVALGGIARADILISVNKLSQRMVVTVDGAKRYNWAVSTGKMGYATPSGSYRPFRLEKTYFSKEFDDAPMPNAIFFTARGHAIHGTYSTRWLGRAVSHGCVRLAPGNAALLYSLVQKEGLGHTRVVITGGPSFGEGLFSGPGPFNDIFGDGKPRKPRKGPRLLENIGNGVNSFGAWVSNTISDATQ